MPRFTERHDLLHKRVERFTRMLQGVEDGDVRAIHRTRVASRRLREVLPVLQLDADVLHKLSRRLRKITDRLGAVRELDVLLAVIDELGQDRPLSAIRAGAGRRHRRGRAQAETRTAADEKPASGTAPRGSQARKAWADARDVRMPRPTRGTERRSWKWAIDARVARRAATLGSGHLQGRHSVSARTAARRADCGQETAVCAGALGARSRR